MHRVRVFGVSAIVGLAAVALPAHGEVKPGDVIRKNNVADAGDMISPGVQWCVRHGMDIHVVAPQRIELPKPYLDATEKYASQVQLAPHGLELKNYVAGLPFPNIDTNDPQAALKIMWNYEYKPLVTDDEDARNFDADGGVLGHHRSLRRAVEGVDQ